MARYRTIKPQTFSDANLTECSRDARLLFIGLWCFVDDMGRAQLSYRQLQNEIFPADRDIDTKTVEGWFGQLVKTGVVEVYEIRPGSHRKIEHYFRIPHFLRHQKIDKPSHTDTPPSPTEDPSKPACLCTNCKIKHRIVFPQERGEDSSNGRRVVDDSSPSTRRPLDEGSLQEVGSVVEVSSGMECSGEREVLRSAVDSQGRNPQTQGPNASPKERNSPSVAAADLAAQLLDLLGVPRNSKIMQVLTWTLQVRAEVDQCSVELAAHRIAGRAAVVARDSPPESWEDWLHDARYDVVPQGDKRINQRGQMARPSCGGSLCSEGWEPVLVDGVRRLRRCPDCVRAWKDAGLG